MSEIIKLEEQQNNGSTKGTFQISVKFMQNSTWQGEILWVEKNQRQNFRSALEMLKLMDEALADEVKEVTAANW